MVTKFRFALCALALTVPAWLILQAAETASPRTTGHVLILENGRTLEGDINREGDQYRVRRSVGETWVSGEKALRLCDNLEEAYEYLRKQANLRDPDERVRLARWCQQHGLRAQALTEITAAVELQPKNSELRHWRQNLQRAVPDANDARPTLPGNSEVHGTSDSVPSVDLTAETVSHFITKVQPILMNTCANCHASGHGGAFKLIRTYDSGSGSRRVSQQNLAAVVSQINVNDWPASSLLIKAVSVHGETGQPPLKSRKTKAFQTLEEWVRQVIEDNPQLREHSALSIPEAAKTGPLGAGHGRPEANPARLEFAVTAATPLPSTKPADSAQPAQPTTSLTPKDPFDPLIFNRQAHPNHDQ